MIARTLSALRAVPRVEAAMFVVATILLVALNVLGDRQTQRVRLDSYSTYDAASGGYRALYELLGREGVRVDRFRSRPAFLDASVGTLVWAEPLSHDPVRLQSAPADGRALEAWVAAGGRLLSLGQMVMHDGLLHYPIVRSRDAHAHRPFIDASLRRAGVTSVRTALNVRFEQRGRGPRSLRTLLDDGEGPLVVRYAYGRGTVVAVIDESLFTNAEIAGHDRARLAVALATLPGFRGAVAFDEAIHGFVTPRHWWSVVPRTFVVALALATVALLVAFAGAAVRLGPPVLPARRDDRSTADFIGGLASLLERAGAVRSALADALRSTSRAVARARGLDDAASPAEIAARIDSDQWRAAYRELVAIATNAYANETNLVRGAALAQRIRKEFVAHGAE